ncbi:outer membrane lipoprotein carrier protein LolA [Cellulomonas sp. 179-A 9B4 NHS]|uniref:LolA family protein n=1 Tax=Cellulomonas sp. 179-A 9B4 NHS TaxID=3142379 RepID=UPI0039A0631B
MDTTAPAPGDRAADSPAPVRRHRARWAVPAVAAVAVGAAFAAPPLLATAGTGGLPEVTPEELLARVVEAEPQALSGTVVHTARLGLPDLSLVEVGGADPIGLLGGSSTLRVWSDGAERSRVSLLGQASEYSVVADGPEAWTYSSSDDAVVHYALSDADRARLDAMVDAHAAAPPVAGDLPTPEELGRAALTRAEQHATVGVDAATTVAGRDAYQVVVTPRGADTLVGRIVVAVDAATWTPLRVQVWGSDDAATPALEVGFTDVTFAAPSDAVLTFSPPPGASVRDVVVPLPEQPAELPAGAPDPQALTEALEDPTATPPLPEGVTVTGDGWDAVVQLAGVDVAGLLAADPAALAEMAVPDTTFGSSEGAQQLLDQFVPADGEGPVPDLDQQALYDELTTPVPGGRLLESSLLSVLVLDDGRVLAGAVPAQTLLDLAG